MLRVLVGGAQGDALREALHEEVVMVLGDGSSLAGRDAVVAFFAHADRATRYEVLSTTGDTLRVLLRVDGVPAELRFTLSGALREGVLAEIRVSSLSF